MKVPEIDTPQSQDFLDPEFDPALPLENDGHESFCHYYLNYANATRAFIEAGYSRNGAGQNAHNLMKKHEVRARIDYLQQKRAERLSIRADRVLEEAAILAHSDIADYEYQGDGKVDVRDKIDPKLRRAIGKVKFKKRSWYDKQLEQVVTEEEVEIGLWDKPKSIEQLGKHLGLFPIASKVQIDDPKQALADMLGVKKEQLP